MASLKLYFAVLIIFLSTVYAAQPELPTNFYGLVLNEGLPSEGVIITAIWIDNDNKKQTTQAQTYTQIQASQKGSNELTGFYFFNKGEIQARSGTNITISLKGVFGSLQIKADPGSNLKQIKTISLGKLEQESTFLGQIAKNLKNSFSGQGKDDDEFQIEEINEPKKNINDVKKDVKEFLDLSFAGEIEEFGKSGIDYDDKIKSSYDIESQLTNSSNGSVEVKESVKNDGFMKKIQENLFSITEQNPAQAQDQQTEENNRDQTKKTVTNLIFGFVSLVLIIGLIALLFAGGYTVVKFGRKKLENLDLSFDPIVHNSKRILHTKINHVTKPALVIEKSKSITDALTLMERNQADLVFVTNNRKYAGYLSEEVFLKIGERSKSAYDLKIEEFMIKNDVVIEKHKTIEEAYFEMENNNITKLAVLENEFVVEEVRLFELQKIVVGMSSHFAQGADSGLPLVKNEMDKRFGIMEKTQDIETARKLMLDNKIRIIVVTDNGKPIGMFTLTDYIRNLFNYQKNLFRYNLENLMSSPITSISQHKNIFEANEFMVKRGFKNYPVIINDKVEGVLTHRGLTAAVFGYLESSIQG